MPDMAGSTPVFGRRQSCGVRCEGASDRLSLTNALADANIDRQAAERIATEIFDAIHDNVATKADLQVVEAALKADLQVVEAALKADLQRVEAALKADLQRVEADLQRVEAALRVDLQRVETALRADLQRVEAGLKAELALRFSELEHRMTVRFGSVMVVLTGIVLAAIRYLPHS